MSPLLYICFINKKLFYLFFFVFLVGLDNNLTEINKDTFIWVLH